MVSLLSPQSPWWAVGFPAAQVCWEACLSPQNTPCFWGTGSVFPHIHVKPLSFKRGDCPEWSPRSDAAAKEELM